MIPPQILTAGGRYFSFTDPDPQSIDIEDIATALSRICRFTGHTTKFYSVAQHSVCVSLLVPKEYALQGLLHDASEAYLGDVSSPLKQLLPDYKAIEQRVERAIMERFGLPFPLHPSIKQADLRMLVTERRDLMPEPRENCRVTDALAWASFSGIEPDGWKAVPLEPALARLLFMQQFESLTKGTD